MAQGLHCRPSEILRIEEWYPAYCFDEAVWSFGAGVEADIESITNKNPKTQETKRRQRLLFLLDAPVEERFRKMRPS